MLRNEEVDCVPGCFWRHFIPEMERGEDIVEALRELQNAGELYHMEHMPPDAPFIRKQIERAKEIVRRLDGECVTLYTAFCPMALFRLQMGWDKMMECIRRDPAAVMYACDLIAQDEMALIEGLLGEAGADGIFYSVQNAELTRFTLEEYHDWVEPSDRKVLEYANSLGGRNVLHCCITQRRMNFYQKSFAKKGIFT